MSFGFPANANRSQTFQLNQPQLIGMIAQALKQLGWHYESPSWDSFLVNRPISFWSWGEKIRVTVASDGTVKAESRGILVTQCIDWGKNRKNLNQFFDTLSHLVTANNLSRLTDANWMHGTLTPLERVIQTDRES